MAVTFGALKARIQREVNRPSASYLEDIGNAIVTAIQFYEKTPLFFNETLGNLTLLPGASTVVLPDDFGSLIDLKIFDTNRFYGDASGFKGMEYVFVSDQLACNVNPGRPRYHALFNNTICMSSIADTNYELMIAYYNKDTSYPVADSDTSIWFGEGVDVIRYHAMGTFYKDRLHSDELGDPKFEQAALYYSNLTTDNNNRDKFNLVLE